MMFKKFLPWKKAHDISLPFNTIYCNSIIDPILECRKYSLLCRSLIDQLLYQLFSAANIIVILYPLSHKILLVQFEHTVY